MNKTDNFQKALRRITGAQADDDRTKMPEFDGIDAVKFHNPGLAGEVIAVFRLYQVYAGHVLAGGDPDVQDGYIPVRIDP
jgi:hypothetical protein